MHLFRIPPGPLITSRRFIAMLGAGGFVFLMLTEGPEKPFYMAICIFMMGLPWLGSADKKVLTALLDRPAPAVEEPLIKEPGP